MTTPHKGDIEAACEAIDPKTWEKLTESNKEYVRKHMKNSIQAYLENIAEDEEVINNMAKVIADSIGHGMREKCIDAAKAALQSQAQINQ